ncbi:MmcQ/YjbR family DNA-binding protein [Stackebrandtia nassauensis]|uniref:MmcQ/YjbR family DNA-binding protein n=1 Tax=Stackebrandtia nassauensis (strain DSM 44728 / CIP 108903 / NRRL B-16338 / NBRC 102104 / LLR-40K-21) TaxID=446470 RepID=D3Q6G9_STANL|nr:MmcQ/YjbR family DNA-binding protein [Stackebrandtia nassauensis]ADD44212.1 protein of unknown function DUF661 [Stackebrandtia nassauensis DSM 44728]
MATWDDVRRIAMALPETTERSSYDGTAAWRVKDKLFVWERPLRGTDREALGESAPDGPILAARVADLGEREALIEQDPKVYFTIPHFDGYPAILIHLDNIDVAELTEVVTDAWFTRAPKRVASQFRAREAESQG